MKLSARMGGTTRPHCPPQIQAIADRLSPEDAMLLKSAFLSAPGKVSLAVRAMELALKNNNWARAREYLVWCKSAGGEDMDAAPESGKEDIALFPWSAGNPEVQ